MNGNNVVMPTFIIYSFRDLNSQGGKRIHTVHSVLETSVILGPFKYEKLLPYRKSMNLNSVVNIYPSWIQRHERTDTGEKFYG